MSIALIVVGGYLVIGCVCAIVASRNGALDDAIDRVMDEIECHFPGLYSRSFVEAVLTIGFIFLWPPDVLSALLSKDKG